ncbi:MAG: hypothetical protein JKX69_07650, partial [Rhodobacteraceae bacterium]|nr:hypothetical protein [Paracoccaceae bacterium]
MKPNFALSLSVDGIGLLHRGSAGWHLVGEVALDADDLGGDLAVLRKTALALDPSGIRCKVLIPNDQIRYLALDTTRTSDEDVRAALAGATPYGVDDLVYDVARGGGRTYIAAVAKETLKEAEAFALEHRLSPVSFAAIPVEFTFQGEPHFGETAAASSIIATGDVVERDDQPIMLAAMRPPILAAAPDAAPLMPPQTRPELQDDSAVATTVLAETEDSPPVADMAKSAVLPEVTQEADDPEPDANPAPDDQEASNQEPEDTGSTLPEPPAEMVFSSRARAQRVKFDAQNSVAESKADRSAAHASTDTETASDVEPELHFSRKRTATQARTHTDAETASQDEPSPPRHSEMAPPAQTPPLAAPSATPPSSVPPQTMAPQPVRPLSVPLRPFINDAASDAGMPAINGAKGMVRGPAPELGVDLTLSPPPAPVSAHIIVPSTAQAEYERAAARRNSRDAPVATSTAAPAITGRSSAAMPPS